MPVTPQDALLAAIKSRANPNQFNYGISTADAYVKTLRECVGSDICYRYAAAKNSSFDDVLRKAAKTLVYGNPEMVVDEGGIEFYKAVAGVSPKQYEGIELPKNTLMTFRHTLTSPRKDRDGDVLRTQGAVVDKNMLLLWQHVHTLPIGKYLMTLEHNQKHLKVFSCIVDMNELCHDAAVMIDNKMGRFSHGFRALDYSELKESLGATTSPGGFDVKAFEVMEESLVSVPSNVDATVDEVILSLVEGKKLKSPLMKAQGKSIREKRPLSIPITVDLKLAFNGQEINDENELADAVKQLTTSKCAGDGKCGCGCGGTPKETDAGANEEPTPALGAENAKVVGETAMCPKCKTPLNGGVCDDCGYEAAKHIAVWEPAKGAYITFELTQDLVGSLAEKCGGPGSGRPGPCPGSGDADEHQPFGASGSNENERDPAASNRKPPAKPAAPKKIDPKKALDIAKKHLSDIKTLDTQESDDADFHDVHVKSIAGMLHDAYKAGGGTAAPKDMFKAYESISARKVGPSSLVEKKSDREDFHQVHVSGIRQGIQAAYAMGQGFSLEEATAKPKKETTEITFKEAAGIVLALATPEERSKLRRSLDALDRAESEHQKATDYEALVR